jgi:serine protease inhibitor
MKTMRLPVLALACSLAATAACGERTGTTTALVVPAAAQEDATLAVAVGVNAMGLDMYAKQRGAAGNLAFSPGSIGFAFGMLYGGARGTSQDAMAKAMHFAEIGLLARDDAAVHQGFAGLLARAGQLDGDRSKLRIANRMWARKDFGFARAFLTLSRELYGAEAENVDFAQGEPVRARINGWVSARRLRSASSWTSSAWASCSAATPTCPACSRAASAASS